MKVISCLLVGLVWPLMAVAQVRPAADLIVTNAKVWTGEKATPHAEAVAVLGERIVAVGSTSDIDHWRGPETQVIDGRGRVLVPGFNDAHVHLVDGGRSLDQVQLKDAAAPEEFARRIGERAHAVPKGEWVLGWGWDDQAWDPPRMPTRELIDPVTGDTPVWVLRYDGHMGLANSAALKQAGITAKTPDPAGGVIVRDESGEPTGLLKDAAMEKMEQAVPPLSPEARRRVIQKALAHAVSLGITSMQDMASSYENIAMYAELAESGEMQARVYVAPPISTWKTEAEAGVRRAFGSHWVRVGALKGFADGSLGSSTAYFFQPFSDDPKNRGLLSDSMQPLDKMRAWMLGADAAGLQVCTHAIGDQAISIVLDLYGEVEKKNGARDRRFRIEHAQHMAAKDFARFVEMGVIASMQPYHAIDDGRWAEARIGHDRATRTYAFRTFLESGVHLAFGSDWPVAPLDPLQGLYAAVTRATVDGRHPEGWIPEQKITLEEALSAFTAGSAYAEFQEKEKGTIAAGKLADLVLLSDDIFTILPRALRDVKVDATIVGGKVVYQRKQP